MPIELAETDFLPPEQCQFQHWGDRDGEPYCHVRPLSESAAERVWRRTAALAGDARDAEHCLNMAEWDEWDAESVKQWLLARVPATDQPVFICYQPKVAVSVPWRVVCDHWLIFFWTGGCVWPASEQWVLVHDGDRFAFGRRRPQG